jgi:hypothetical protein
MLANLHHHSTFGDQRRHAIDNCLLRLIVGLAVVILHGSLLMYVHAVDVAQAGDNAVAGNQSRSSPSDSAMADMSRCQDS